MRNVLATDIKNNIRSIRFILGIFSNRFGYPDV